MNSTTTSETANKSKFNVALLKAETVEEVIDAMYKFYEPATGLNIADRLKIIAVLTSANFLKFKKETII